MTKTYWVIGVVLLVVLAAGFIAYRSSGPGAFGCTDCNVIIIGVDTLRADHVHSLGYGLNTTPTIDALAAKGYTFSNAIAPASWTVPSFMSVMTGVYPSVHKVINKFTVFTPTEETLSNLKALAPTVVTLAEVMKGAGYATGGFTGDAGVSGKFGYAQGFDVYTDEKTFGGFENSDQHALAWLDSLSKGQKFFMFFHGYDLHGQFPLGEQTFVPQNYQGSYTGSPAEEARLREAQLSGPITLTAQDVDFWKGVYDSKIRSADDQLKNFLSQLESRGLLKNTIVVVVADHGEEYYEHGGFDHGHALYDELIHVPLIIAVPNTLGGTTITGQVSTMDLGPALLSMLGVTAPAAYASQTAGRPNLLSYLKNPDKAGYTVYSETDYRDFTHKRAIRTADGWKYILTLESGMEELYNVATDTEEKNNLAKDPAAAAKLKELHEALLTHMTKDLHADPSAPMTQGCLPVYQGECQ